jgi:hypothetical protein
VPEHPVVELTGRTIRLDFESHPSLQSDEFPLNFDISISELRPLPPAQDRGSEADKVGHLGARFQFDGKDCRILSIFASGSFLESDKHNKLNKLVDAHPDWSEAQTTSALRAAGGKFGPNGNNEVVASFHADMLEPVLGKIQIVSTKFTFRGNREPPFYAIMERTIYFQAISGDRQDEYFVSIEPFGARITSLGRRIDSTNRITR